jgi:septal ring factor EnvC (AmiA/AmiB activator)
MSGRPNAEGIREFRRLQRELGGQIETHRRLERQKDELQRELEASNKKINELTAAKAATLSRMDLLSVGNAGYEQRRAAFLLELSRQYEEELDRLRNPGVLVP